MVDWASWLKAKSVKEDEVGPLTPDEIFGKQMDRVLPDVARWLGVCVACFEDLKLIEGKGWVCMHCERDNPLDVTAEEARAAGQ